ncbi:MAG: hypothetical protein QG635_835 [Bacteroidota bacterium]|nr:hypothetical protein [Bacteroidota bacterium]
MKRIKINTCMKLPLVELTFNRLYLLIGFILLSFGKVIVDSLLYVFFIFDSQTVIIWKTISFALVFVPVFLYVFSKGYEKDENGNKTGFESYFNDLRSIIIILLLYITLCILVPASIFDHGIPKNIFWLLISDILSIIIIVFTNIILLFLYKYFVKYKHKKTNLYIRILILGLIYFLLIDYVTVGLKIGKNEVLDFLIPILYIILGIIVLFNTQKNSWIAVLPKSDKVKLLFTSLVVIIINILILSLSKVQDNSFKYLADIIIPGGFSFLKLTLFYLTIYFTRLVFSVLAALPTTALVERRTSELSSLAYLSKIVSETIDFDNLIETVTKLSLHVCKAAASWAEVYDSDGGIRIASSQIISPEQVRAIHDKNPLREKFIEFERSTLVASIPEDAGFNYLSTKYKLANSMIIMPLLSRSERIGSLIVIHPEEYGFEEDDVSVLSAFGDNISVALENNRLLSEAIEKEHYKRELMLAQEIQNKLLPQTLPELKKYSLAAFSLPSEEVGGDYYDFIRLKDGKPCILIGDVSGKGITSAFYMAQLKGVVLSLASNAEGAADILKKINSTLFGSMEKQMYITMTSLVVDNMEGDITIARAGHMPLIITKNGTVDMLTPGGLGIGLAPSSVFDKALEEISIRLNEGDKCLLITDGLNELRNESGEEFGYEPLKQILLELKDNDSCELRRQIKNKIADYKGSAQQHDDITVVSLIYGEPTCK